jgi:hypothetical protein
MTRLAVIVLFILVYSVTASNIRATEPLAPAAIKAVIDDYYARNVHEVEVINFGVRNGHGEKTIEKLLKLGSPTIPLKVTRDVREKPQSEVFELKLPSIVLFDSPENFNKTQDKIVFQSDYIISHPHIVYIHNATFKDIQVVSEKNFTIDRTIFLVNETQNSIELATSFMFTAEACGLTHFKVINRLERKQNRWINSNFFMDKYKNFHGCPLGIKQDILCEVLNFTYAFYDNGTKREDEFVFQLFMLPPKYLIYKSYIIHVEPQKIYIPPGELYGDYEKMILPFNTTAWIGIIVTIVVTICGIVAIKVFLPNNQDLYFGRSTRSPFMNFISIMINGSQHGSMIENAPRIFLMTFVFCSLILR